MEEGNGNNDKYKTGSTLGGWLGYFGDQINNMTEYIGLNNVLSNASNNFSNSLEKYNLKDTINKAVNYTKTAGEFVIDKAKEISQSQIVNDTREKITNTLEGLRDNAFNMINQNNIENNNNANNENNINNNDNNQ